MVDRFQSMVDRFLSTIDWNFQSTVDKIYQSLIEIYQPLTFFINGMLFDNYLLTVIDECEKKREFTLVSISTSLLFVFTQHLY